jgi:hypothetical protein
MSALLKQKIIESDKELNQPIIRKLKSWVLYENRFKNKGFTLIMKLVLFLIWNPIRSK